MVGDGRTAASQGMAGWAICFNMGAVFFFFFFSARMGYINSRGMKEGAKIR